MEKAELEARVKALESDKAELQTAHEALKAEAAFVAEGKQYRADLIAEISRKLGVLKRPADVVAKLLKSADVVTLKEYDAALADEVNALLGATPQSKMLGEPNGAALVPGQGEPPPPTPGKIDPYHAVRG